MIQGTEISPGLWLLQNGDTAHNAGIILSEGSDSATAAAATVTLIDPGSTEVEQDALQRFLSDMHASVTCLFFTTEPDPSELAMWPDAAYITPANIGGQIDLSRLAPGWNPVILSNGFRLGLYNRRERTLFCGDMLCKDRIPALKSGVQNYLDALDSVAALDVRLALPGAGPEARGKREVKARIEYDRSYAMSLLRHIMTSRAARAPLDRVLQVASEVYEDSPYLETHLANIRTSWNEA